MSEKLSEELPIETLSDVAAERAVLSGIYQYGSDAYYDVVDFTDEKTFTVESNVILFKCLKAIIKNDDSTKMDIASILSIAKTLGLDHIVERRDEMRHMKNVISFPVELSNVRKFAAKIRKLQIARLLQNQLQNAQDNILKLKGDESITHILGIAEDTIFNFTTLINDGDDENPQQLGNELDKYLKNLVDNPVDQVGISTGFTQYDKAIGGGLRRGTVNIIGARPKVGKTLLADNMAIHITKEVGIPVLNIDTEMRREDHINRCLAAVSEVDIKDIETGQFGQKADVKQKVRDAYDILKDLPYYHKSIGGIEPEEQIAIIRRWLIKEVGLEDNGMAKPCVIIYDYIKLMTTEGLKKNLQEYQLLGFLITSLHNFALRYSIPILAFCQLNRDGITKESTDVSSGSDRIIWLCSNFTIFKNKSDEEIAEDGTDAGNRKLVPIVSRHGEGLEDKDYINCHMKGWCAQIKEGMTRNELHNKKNGPVDEVVDDKDVKF